jgi:hypothetical protein
MLKEYTPEELRKKHIARVFLDTIFVLGFAALAGREYRNNGRTWSLYSTLIMALGMTIRTAADYADPERKRGFFYKVGSMVFLAGVAWHTVSRDR